jgi:hypothetical protein
MDNVEKALGCKPVRIGKEGLETFVYRGDVANNALKMAGQEIGLFLEARNALLFCRGARAICRPAGRLQQDGAVAARLKSIDLHPRSKASTSFSRLFDAER